MEHSINHKDWLALEKLRKKWFARRDRLGKKAADLNKVDVIANKMHAQYHLGKFAEIDKCRAELTTIINHIDKYNIEKLRKQHQQESKMHVIETPENVDVYFHTTNEFDQILLDRPRGTASANPMEKNGEWWISRMLITPESARSKGLGTKMLKKLKQGVFNQGCRFLIVTPGGYDSKKRKQMNFYLKNGFTKRNDGTLVWDPYKEPIWTKNKE